MSELTLQTWTMPAAELGPENPLTPLHAYRTASAAPSGLAAPAASGASDYPDRGKESSILPYRLQDGYDRNRQPRAFKTAVLENDILRATFLLELGGRLWSLYHKPDGRELLFVNPMFQPANLAIRDAWFSGGVEWNISIIGHSPFTCAPLFAARVEGEDGSPMLRLYEWDRIRGVPFQIDCTLPDGSPFLFVRVRIVNPHDHAVPMYWWSNIAAPESPQVRVLAPAGKAFRHNYDRALIAHDVPIYNGIDVTYPANRPSAADLYFRIPPGHRPWVAALDGQGHGLIHTSTARLLGRKMFNWGAHPGGQRWQEFLNGPGQRYIEIQGGLAPTQGEYLPMPAGDKWEWLEAYGTIESDATAVHGRDWDRAWNTVEAELERRLPWERMATQLSRSAAAADRPPVELLHLGSGWGALERRRRSMAKEPPFASQALPFPDESLGPEQKPWLQLLEQGQLPHGPPQQPPVSLMVQSQWRALLEEHAAHRSAEGNWLTWYHLGVMRYRAGEHEAARQAWQRSLAVDPSPWAFRDLAVLALDQGDDQSAADLWLRAARLAPQVVPLAVECCGALLAAGRAAEQMRFIDTLPPVVRRHGRVRVLRAQAALELDDLEAVRLFFEDEFEMSNVREKETVLSDLWFGWQEKRLVRQSGAAIDEGLRQRVRREFPPPPRFDFRLRNE